MTDWEERIEAAWAIVADDEAPDAIIARIDALADERGPHDGRAVFERAGARDSAGREAEAIVLYRRALELGLDAEHHPQCVVQLASSLRNVGEYDQALRVLADEEKRDPNGEYGDAIAVVRALTLASSGRPSAGLSTAILALVPHLPRYQRSMTAYALEIADRDT